MHTALRRVYRAAMTKDYNPLDLAGQRRDRENAERREQHAREVEGEDFKKLMATAWGRRFVWRLLEKAGMYRTSFTGNSETFFREGMRNFGIMLTALINEHCPEQYMLMVNESKDTKEKK